MPRAARPSPSRLTLEEVARAAGVSVATASRALNGSSRRVSPDLESRVRRVAEQMGYRPNVHAQAMARGRGNIIGLVIHDITDPYFSSIASGVIRSADEHEMIVTVTSTSSNQDRELECVAVLRRQQAAAIVLAGSRVADRAQEQRIRDELAAYQAEGGRAVVVGQEVPPFDAVRVDNREGAQALAAALAAQGLREFAVLAGPPGLVTATDRLAGFLDGLAPAGHTLPPARVVHGEFTREGAQRAMATLLPALPRGTCVFAVNDVMAVGAVWAIREAGLAIGTDILVAGFDDIPAARDLTPPLTTVRVPMEDLGRHAAQLALRPYGEPPAVVRILPEVVLRESTGAVRRL